MNGPDSSLFQGPEGLMIQNVGQLDMEHEAEEDKRKMNAELDELLSKAFPDLTDDDDDDDATSVGSECSDFNATQEDGEHVSSKPEQEFVIDVNNIVHSPSNSIVLDSAISTVMKMGKPAGNRFASHLISHLPSVHEDDGMLTSQEDLSNGDSNISNHYFHCYRSNPGGYGDSKEDITENIQLADADKIYRETSYNSMEQLQVLYEVRVREVEKLRQQLQEERLRADEEKKKISSELILCEADKEREKCLHREAENLLFSSKKKVDELEKQVEMLKHEISNLEESNTQLKLDFGSSQASNVDLQQKLLMLERNSMSNNSKHCDSFVKNYQKKHEQELLALKTELDIVTAKLNNKESDCSRLDQQVLELTRAQEALIMEKAETMNRMARTLEDSQRQYQQLAGSAASQDNVRLSMQLSAVSQEKADLERKVQAMKKEVESLKFDLQQYENATRLGVLNSEDFLLTDSMIQLGIAKSGENSTKFPTSEQPNLDIKLKDEFHRSLFGQKIKREEIKRLKLELEKKDEIIKNLKEEEVKYLAVVDKFKEDIKNHMSELKKHTELSKEIENYEKKNAEILHQLRQSESEVSRLNNELACIRKARDDLEEQNSELRQNIDSMVADFDKEISHESCSKQYLRFHDEAVAKVKMEMSREAASRVTELSTQLENALKESQEVKQLYIEINDEKEHLREQLREEQETVINLTAEVQAKTEEVDRLYKELSAQKKISEKLSDELKHFQEEVDSLTKSLELEQIKSKEAQQMNVKDMENYKEDFQKNVEERARQLYTCRVTEEINTAKIQALQEIEHVWKKEKDDYITQIEQLTNICSHLQERVKDYDEKCSEIENCKKHIEELMTELQQNKFLIVQLRIKEKLSEQAVQMEVAHRATQVNENVPFLRSATDDTEGSRCSCAKLHAAELKTLRLKHQSEMEEQREKIKQDTVNYFANEILNIEAKHKLALQECEAATAKELSSLQELIMSKTRELDALKQLVDDERARLQPCSDDVWKEKINALTNELMELKSYMRKHSVSEQEKQIAALKSCLELKEKQVENVRNKFSELVMNHTREVQSLRKSNEELSRKYVECVAKYKTAKMRVEKYKKYADDKEKHLMKQYKRIRDGYQNAVSAIQKKVEEAVGDKESVITSQVIALEKQIQQLKQKQSAFEVA